MSKSSVQLRSKKHRIIVWNILNFFYHRGTRRIVELVNPFGEVPVEYKLSSFKFSSDVSREEKHLVIKKINSIRSRCPSDSNFTGQFSFENNLVCGEVKVLFSKGSFFVKKSGANMSELLDTILSDLDDQISAWKRVRFDQPETFIDYSEWLNRKTATGT